MVGLTQHEVWIKRGFKTWHAETGMNFLTGVLMSLHLLLNTFQFQKLSLNRDGCLYELPPRLWCWSDWIYWQQFARLSTQSSCPLAPAFKWQGWRSTSLSSASPGRPASCCRKGGPVTAGVTSAWARPHCRCKHSGLNIGMSVPPISASFRQWCNWCNEIDRLPHWHCTVNERTLHDGPSRHLRHSCKFITFKIGSASIIFCPPWTSGYHLMTTRPSPRLACSLCIIKGSPCHIWV